MKRGFTLIEVLLALSISVVIVSTAVSMYLSFVREYSAIQEKQRINNEFMRVNQNFIKQIVENRLPPSAVVQPAATCTVNISTETVGARTLFNIQLSAQNRATQEVYTSSLVLVAR